MRTPADWRKVGQLFMVLMLMTTVVACGGQTVVTEGDVTLLVHKDSLLPRGGEDALITGTLVLSNGCVGLASDEDPDRVVAAIWPSGTGLDDVDPLSLRLPSGTLLTEGQSVQGAGGYHAPDSAEITLEIPTACELDPEAVAVFNPDDDPVVVD